MERVRGMWREPAEAGYNPDGELPKRNCPMRTVAAVELLRAKVAAEGNQHITVNIQSIMLPEKRQVVDVEVVEVEPARDP